MKRKQRRKQERKEKKRRFVIGGRSMVRRQYISKRPEEIWRAAMQECDNRMKIREVARLYHIPESTLRNRRKKENVRDAGGATILTEAEETRLVQHIISMSKLHLPLDMDAIREIAGDIDSQSDRPKRFIAKVASE